MILLGLAGSPGSGRDRISNHLVVAHNWAQYRMINPVRRILEEGIGVPAFLFLPGNRQDSLLNNMPCPAALEDSLYAWGIGQNPEMWRALAAKYIREEAFAAIEQPPGVVISDVSESDCEWIRKNGGTIWHCQSIDKPDHPGVSRWVDDEITLVTHPGQDVGPLVDVQLRETLALYVAK